MIHGLQDVWGLLPPLVFAAIVLNLVRAGSGFAAALSRGAILWATCAWVGANALGAFGAVSTATLRVWWFGLGVVAWAPILRSGSRPGGAPVVAPFWPAGALEGAMALGCASLVIVAGVTAAVSPPATVDVLNYHLPRQLMWLQQGGLQHFATTNDRMLMMPPLAEVIGLHFLALTGDDHWANMPQWFAYAATPFLVFAAVRGLGGGRVGAWTAAWLFATLPMAWHEASNAKNDLQGALWMMIILTELLRARADARTDWKSGAWAGAAAGLALLTKSTAFLWLPPLVVAGVLVWRKKDGWPAAGRASAVAALIAALLTAPFFARNLARYGTPLGEHRAEDGGRQTNEIQGPRAWASNAMRVATLHAAGPWPGWNAALETAVKKAHAMLGLDENDPRTTLWVTRYAVDYAPDEETQAGAAGHALIILISVAVIAVGGARQNARWLAACLAASAFAYLAVLKWQPWAPRLQLPLFTLGIVAVGTLVGKTTRPRRSLAWAWAAIGAGLVTWWPARETRLRPLWTAPTVWTLEREQAMHRHLPALVRRDAHAVALVRQAGVKESALVYVHDSVYPLMRRLRRDIPGFRFADGSGAAPESLLLCDHFRPPPARKRWTDGTEYRLVGDEAGDALYLPEDTVKKLGWENRMPPFVGWSRHSGLRFSVAQTPDDPPAWREVAPSETGKVFFRSVKKQTFRLTLALADPEPDKAPPVIRLNGTPLHANVAQGELVFDGDVAARAGENEIGLEPSADSQRAARLVRLRITETDASAR